MAASQKGQQRRGVSFLLLFCLFLGLSSLHNMTKTVLPQSFGDFMTDISHIAVAKDLTMTYASTQKVSRRLSLSEITRSDETYSCPDGLVYVNDTVLPDYDSPGDRKIPRVVHITAKSRCLTPAFAENVDRWRLPGHSLFFHDDDAVDRFFHQGFPLFPQLTNVLKCVSSGAAKADIWRYLMIWEHGGIYTDFDNTFTAGFQRGEAIDATDDAWWPLEADGMVAQYFYAASPQHPIMYTSLHSALTAVWSLDDISNDQAPYTTGPTATRKGFVEFMKAVGVQTDGFFPAGKYVGMNNRSVIVVGDKTKPHEFVHRGGVGEKWTHYRKMNMVHFSKKRSNQHHSCSQHIYYTYLKEMNQTLTYHLEDPEANELSSVETIDCSCPSTCNATALAYKNPKLPYTCEQRIEYTMFRHELSQSKACSSAVKLAACGSECNPDKCDGE